MIIPVTRQLINHLSIQVTNQKFGGGILGLEFDQ